MQVFVIRHFDKCPRCDVDFSSKKLDRLSTIKCECGIIYYTQIHSFEWRKDYHNPYQFMIDWDIIQNISSIYFDDKREPQITFPYLIDFKITEEKLNKLIIFI